MLPGSGLPVRGYLVGKCFGEELISLATTDHLFQLRSSKALKMLSRRPPRGRCWSLKQFRVMIMNETNFSVGEEERQAADHGEDPVREEKGGR